MNELVERFRLFLQEHNIAWDNQTLVVLAILLAVLFFLAFLAIRSVFDRGGARATSDLNDDSILLPPPPRGWAGRFDQAFEKMVQRTGLGATPQESLGWILFGAVLVGIACYAVRPELPVAGAGFVGGGLGVLAVLSVFAARHRRRVQEQLPDALAILARSIRANQSLDEALALVGRQGGDAVAPEFRRAAAQIRLGLPTIVALENMARRVRLLDVNALVSAVALHQTTGGNLPHLLDRLAAGARDRNQFHGYVRSATALGRISALAIAVIAPGVVVIYSLFQPDYAQIMLQTRTGLTLIGAALALELLGCIWLYRLQRIEP